MTRLLFIARYRDATMRRKIEYLARDPALTIWHICPSAWQDEFLHVRQTSAQTGAFRQTALPMWGRPTDPHRAFYHTLTFGLRRFQPDLVHAEEEPDSLAALQIALARRLFAPRAKLILNTWQNVNRPKTWPVRWVMQTTLQASAGVLCANSEAAVILRQHGFHRPTAIIPAVGADAEVFRPCERPERGDGTFVVGYVGRLAPEKGLDTLLHAMRRLPAATSLQIMGDGSSRAELLAQVATLGLAHRVRLLPPAPPAQVAHHLAQLDVLTLPSRSTPLWKEQFGRVLVEAMACKVPVVGSNSGAIPEVIGDGGLIFPEADAAALADCLHKLMASPPLRRDLAERGYARVSRLYTQERLAEQIAAFYRTIL